MNSQMIFKRYELKYLINRPQMEAIRGAMSAYMEPDEYGKSLIQSLYFDTDDFRLIRRSMEHPVYKEKLRVRSYGIATAETPVFLELKKKYDSVVYKRRMLLTEGEAKSYLFDGCMKQDTQIAREIDYSMKFYGNPAPKVLIQCQREAFFGKDDHEFRVTFDDGLLWRDYDLTLTAGRYGNDLILPDEVLMEIKTATSIPLWMSSLLTYHHIHKTTFSKYGTAYQIMCQKGEYHYDRHYLSEPVHSALGLSHRTGNLPALRWGGAGHRRVPRPELHC